MFRDSAPSGGAEHLARIHGTEEDKVNCPFYFKIGACRHGDRCSRQHHRPPFSQTLLIPHMWQNPMCTIASVGGDITNIDDKKFQEDFDEFYDEIFLELQKFGKVEDVQVCENLCDHMVGNVYVKFSDEEFTEAALRTLHGRFYAGRMLSCEYSPVTDFREARCRQFDEGTCQRGPYCNFMHIREPSNELRKFLEKQYDFTGGRMKGTASMNTMKMDGGGSGGGGGGGGYDRRDRGGGSGGGDRGYDRYSRDDGRNRRPSPSGDRYRDRDRDRERYRDRDRSSRDRNRDRDHDRDRDRPRDRNRDYNNSSRGDDRSGGDRSGGGVGGSSNGNNGSSGGGEYRDRDRDRDRDRGREFRDRN